VGEDDGVLLLFQPVDLEGERRDLAAGVEVPRPAARVTVDVHQRAEQAFRFLFNRIVDRDQAHGRSDQRRPGGFRFQAAGVT
jgi:hypothetical protein